MGSRRRLSDGRTERKTTSSALPGRRTSLPTSFNLKPTSGAVGEGRHSSSSQQGSPLSAGSVY